MGVSRQGKKIPLENIVHIQNMRINWYTMAITKTTEKMKKLWEYMRHKGRKTLQSNELLICVIITISVNRALKMKKT